MYDETFNTGVNVFIYNKHLNVKSHWLSHIRVSPLILTISLKVVKGKMSFIQIKYCIKKNLLCSILVLFSIQTFIKKKIVQKGKNWNSKNINNIVLVSLFMKEKNAYHVNFQRTISLITTVSIHCIFWRSRKTIPVILLVV